MHVENSKTKAKQQRGCNNTIFAHFFISTTTLTHSTLLIMDIPILLALVASALIVAYLIYAQISKGKTTQPQAVEPVQNEVQVIISDTRKLLLTANT